MVHTRRRSSTEEDDEPYETSNEEQSVVKSSPRAALEKCARSLVEIHRLLRETSESMSSKESTPSDAVTANHARRKWSAAFRVVQGLHRFKLPLHRTVREREMHYSNESTPSREIEDTPIDPVYLALKQATGKYGRRGSSTNNLDSGTPSPRNLSQVSLQDSGYVDMNTANNHDPMLGSTPHLDNAGRSTGRRRAPKLTTQMKSLSLDYQEMPPKIQAANRSPLRSKLAAREYRAKNSASDLSDWDRSCSPCTVTSRRSSASLANFGGHIVIHEYCPPNGGPALQLGERIRVVDNGDPDWLHGFRASDRTEYLMSFPATCVAPIRAGEQPMRIQQNFFVAEQKLRMYRDQIVFAQPDTLQDSKVTVRTEHNAFAACPLSSLALLTMH